MPMHVLATKQTLPDADGKVEEVEEEVEEEQWFTGPAMLRATAAEKYVAKWQTRRKAAANWALWDFEVPFQPFDGASLNEPPLSFFSRTAKLKKSKKKLKRSNGSRALRCCAPEVRGEVTDPQEAAANWALWDFE
eukprot:gene21472-33032_t